MIFKKLIDKIHFQSHNRSQTKNNNNSTLIDPIHGRSRIFSEPNLNTSVNATIITKPNALAKTKRGASSGANLCLIKNAPSTLSLSNKHRFFGSLQSDDIYSETSSHEFNKVSAQ